MAARARHARRRPGRRQERLPGRDDPQPRRPRRGRPRRLRHHGARLPGVPGARRARRPHQRCARQPRRRRRGHARQDGRADPPVGDGHALPGVARSRRRRGLCRARDPVRNGRVLGRPLVRHGRGSAGRLLRRAAGDLPERPRPHQRQEAHPRGVRLALQRPRDRLSRAPGFRSQPGRAVGRHPEDGAVGPGRERRHVHPGHRIRIPGRRLRHLELRARRDGRAGRGQPRRVLRPQADPARRSPGGAAPQRRGQGNQDGLRRVAAGGASREDRRGARGRPSGVLSHRPGGRGPRPAGPRHRGALWPPDGHRVGARRHRRAPLHRPGPARDRAEPLRARDRALRARPARQGAERGPVDRQPHRRRRRQGDHQPEPDGARAAGPRRS